MLFWNVLVKVDDIRGEITGWMDCCGCCKVVCSNVLLLVVLLDERGVCDTEPGWVADDRVVVVVDDGGSVDEKSNRF